MSRKIDENDSHSRLARQRMNAPAIVLSLSALVVLASCSDSDPATPLAPVDPVTPPAPVIATLTLDAANDWAFADFDGEVAIHARPRRTHMSRKMDENDSHS